MHWFAFFCIGLATGVLGGLFGIGGGIIMIPCLMFLMGFGQQQAVGTTLAAMIPPIGILAAYEYFQEGQVNVPAAILIAAGFLIGGFFGARISLDIDPVLAKRLFGAVLFLVSMRFMFWS
jgi:uncharacterized protein